MTLTRKRLAAGLCRDPLRELTALPRPLVGSREGLGRGQEKAGPKKVSSSTRPHKRGARNAEGVE